MSCILFFNMIGSRSLQGLTKICEDPERKGEVGETKKENNGNSEGENLLDQFRQNGVYRFWCLALEAVFKLLWHKSMVEGGGGVYTTLPFQIHR